MFSCLMLQIDSSCSHNLQTIKKLTPSLHHLLVWIIEVCTFFAEDLLVLTEKFLQNTAFANLYTVETVYYDYYVNYVNYVELMYSKKYFMYIMLIMFTLC